MRMERLEIRTETSGSGLALETLRERGRSRERPDARRAGRLEPCGTLGVKRAQDPRFGPMDETIEAHEHRGPSLWSLCDPPRDRLKLRDAPLRDASEEGQRHVQALFRHRAAARGPHGLARRVNERGALPGTASARSTPGTRSARSAISRTVCSLTAPRLWSVRGATPRSRAFAASE